MRVLPVAVLITALVPAAVAAPEFGSLTSDGTTVPHGREQYLSGDVPPGCDVQNQSRPLTLVDVVSYALCSGARTRKAWEEIFTKNGALTLARADYLPTVNATGSGDFRKSKINVQEDIFDNSDQHTKGYSGNIEVDWKLYDFGLTQNKNRSAKFALHAAIANRDSAVQSVTVDASQAFFDVLDTEAEVSADTESQNYAEASLASAKSRYESGMAVLTDMLQAKTAYAQARVKTLKADGELRNAIGKLCVIIGLDANAALQLDHSEDVAPEEVYLESIQKLMAEAKLNSPDLEAARATADSAYADLQAARADGRPTVTLVGELRARISRSDSAYNITGSSTLPPDNEQHDKSIELRVSVPLFTGFSHSAKVAEAHAAAEEADIALQDAERQLTLQVWQAYQSLQTETQSYRETSDLVLDAKESYQAAKGRYDAGVGTVVEMLNAQSALSSAQTERIKSVSRWRLAKLKLAASLGHLKV